MVKHIVLFKLKENLSTEEKQAVIDKFKAAIEALPPVIPSIRKSLSDKISMLTRNGIFVWKVSLIH